MNRCVQKRLVRRIINGDNAACAQLVRTYQDVIYGFLLHLSRDRRAAEELTCDTFAAAWMNLAGFRGFADVSTWLHRIAYRRFLDWQRQARRMIELKGRASAVTVNGEVPNPLDELLVSEEMQRLSWAIAGLDPPGREVIVLHYFQGLSFRRMADVLGEPSGTVKWRTSAALARLKVMLNEKREEESSANEKQRLPIAGESPAKISTSDGAC